MSFRIDSFFIRIWQYLRYAYGSRLEYTHTAEMIIVECESSRVREKDRRLIVRCKTEQARDGRDWECARGRVCDIAGVSREAWRAGNLSNYRTITLSN